MSILASQLDELDRAMKYEQRELGRVNALALEASLTCAHPLMQAFLSDKITNMVRNMREIEFEREILRASLK
jgi:hypothetical protein